MDSLKVSTRATQLCNETWKTICEGNTVPYRLAASADATITPMTFFYDVFYNHLRGFDSNLFIDLDGNMITKAMVVMHVMHFMGSGKSSSSSPNSKNSASSASTSTKNIDDACPTSIDDACPKSDDVCSTTVVSSFGLGKSTSAARRMSLESEQSTASQSSSLYDEDNILFCNEAKLSKVARAHGRVGVDAKYFSPFLQCIVATVGKVLGPNLFTGEVHRAWVQISAFVLHIMVRETARVRPLNSVTDSPLGRLGIKDEFQRAITPPKNEKTPKAPLTSARTSPRTARRASDGRTSRAPSEVEWHSASLDDTLSSADDASPGEVKVRKTAHIPR